MLRVLPLSWEKMDTLWQASSSKDEVYEQVYTIPNHTYSNPAVTKKNLSQPKTIAKYAEKRTAALARFENLVCPTISLIFVVYKSGERWISFFLGCIKRKWFYNFNRTWNLYAKFMVCVSNHFTVFISRSRFWKVPFLFEVAHSKMWVITFF